MKEQLSIITFYYPPEIGAASNRIHQMVNGLRDKFEITVISPLPNYPKGKIFKEYKGKLVFSETKDGVTIKRLWVYATNSKKKLPRLLGMLSFSLSICIYFLTNKSQEKVIIQSPPLLMAFTSVFLSSKKRVILNVSDLWPSAGKALGVLKSGYLYKLLLKIEAYNYKHADLIMCQSEEIIQHVKSIAASSKTFLYRNYPNIELTPPLKSRKPDLAIKIVYAGLLGHAQGILKLCNGLIYDNIELHIYGSGPEEKALTEWIKQNPEKPVFFHGEVSRTQLHTTICNYDLAIIPLIKPLFGSTPSKIFEYSSLGLPLLYFAGGEGESIVSKNELGWVAECSNYKELNEVIQRIFKTEINTIDREKLKQKSIELFNFEKQLNALKETI